MRSKINRIITVWTTCVILFGTMLTLSINTSNAAVEPTLTPPPPTTNSRYSRIDIGRHNRSIGAANASDERGDIAVPAVLSTRQNGKIAFAASYNENRTNSIFTVNPDGTNRQQVYTESFGSLSISPSFSPDGRRIAFASNRSGSGDIYTINADGANLQRVTTNQALEREPSWSPDGTRIAFHRSNGIYVTNTDGSNERLITASAVGDVKPSWSPDGARIAFHRVGNNTDIYTINVDGTDLQRVTTNPAWEAFPSWSPDGTRIAFVSTRNGNDDIYTINTDGTDEQRLTTSSFLDFNPSWSPDGTRIAFHSRRTGNSDIYTMNADGTGVQRVTNSPDTEFAPSWGAATLPSGWAATDIGSVGVSGSTTFSDGVYTVKGSGSDIWEYTDAFHFAYRQLSGNCTITARVTNLENTDPWAKAGVMIRESLAGNAAHAMTIITPSNGVALQSRAITDAATDHQGAAGNAPQWLRLTRDGNILTGYASSDGTDWTTIGTTTVNLGQNVYIGLAVTAHNNSALNTATFDNVSVQTILPAGWSATDIGSVGEAGLSTFNDGVYTVSGSGSDIWEDDDAFHFAYRELSGDGTITARVISQQNTDQWAKAGVMIRESLAANAAHAMTIVTPSNGVALQSRATTGALSDHQGAGGNAPQWVRLVRQGTSLTGYTSSDGMNWVTIGVTTVNLNQTAYIGLAVTAHNNQAVSTATFDNVTVQ